MQENASIRLCTFGKISLFSKGDLQLVSACFFTRMCFRLDTISFIVLNANSNLFESRTKSSSCLAFSHECVFGQIMLNCSKCLYQISQTYVCNQPLRHAFAVKNKAVLFSHNIQKSQIVGLLDVLLGSEKTFFN